MRAPKQKAKGPSKLDLRWKKMFLLTRAYVDEFKELPNQFGDYQSWSEDKWQEIRQDSSKAFPVGILTEKVPHLGRWRHNQCKRYRKGKLSASRISELETITGWIWDADYEATWYEALQELIEFVEEHGELPKSTAPKDKYKGVNLYKWMHNQRRDRRLLSKERIEQLEEIRGWTWIIGKRRLSADEWDDKYTLLKQYVEKYRNPRSIPTKGVIYKDVQLGRWCSNQRMEYKRGTLSKEKQKKLESITGWYWKKESRNNDPNWNYKLTVLKKFISEYGRLPRQREVFQGKKIGKWCQKQRTLYNFNSLPDHRIKELNKIPEWRWQLR